MLLCLLTYAFAKFKFSPSIAHHWGRHLASSPFYVHISPWNVQHVHLEQHAHSQQLDMTHLCMYSNFPSVLAGLLHPEVPGPLQDNVFSNMTVACLMSHGAQRERLRLGLRCRKTVVLTATICCSGGKVTHHDHDEHHDHLDECSILRPCTLMQLHSAVCYSTAVE